MGFYSQVQITAETKALEMFRAAVEKFGWAHTTRELDGYGVITFDWVKWYPEFEEVQAVEEVRQRLCDEHDNDDGYGFKMIILNEDDTHEEYSNDRGDAQFCDICIQCHIYNPYDVQGGGK